MNDCKPIDPWPYNEIVSKLRRAAKKIESAHGGNSFVMLTIGPLSTSALVWNEGCFGQERSNGANRMRLFHDLSGLQRFLGEYLEKP